MALVGGYSGFSRRDRGIALTTLRLHRCPNPKRFVRLDGSIGPYEDIVSLTGLSARGSDLMRMEDGTTNPP